MANSYRNGYFFLTDYRKGYIIVLPNRKAGERLELREAREKAGMSMMELGKAVGVSPAAICRYEQGKRTPKTDIAKKIAKILSLKWYDLIDNKKAG
jgi:DNA-binding XRE family transcriptional regulator